MTREVTVHGSAPALVDDADFALVSRYRWHRLNTKGYAATMIDGKHVYMHRLLAGVRGRRLWVDHVNKNVLDNRRCNLRVCTPLQSRLNTTGKRGTSSQFKGVTRRGDKWAAAIQYKGKTVYLGRFASEIEAAQHYDVAASRYFGEFAHLNLPLLQSERAAS